MPNYVQNVIKVTKKAEEFKALVLNENEEFDFNKIIPQPKELLINSGSCSYVSTAEPCKYPEGSTGHFTYMVCKNIELTLEKFYNEEISQDDFATLVLEETTDNPYFNWYGVDETSNIDKEVERKARGYWNLKRFGYIDWYDWSYDNWGTKWNAGETYVSGDLFIEFQTAWNTPDNIWVKLAELGFEFTVAYADEDFGSNLGIIKAEGGKAQVCNFKDLPLNERIYLSSIIFYGVDYENADDEDEEYKVSVEKQEELLESVKEFLI